jgi:hypothetical protein
LRLKLEQLTHFWSRFELEKTCAVL